MSAHSCAKCIKMWEFSRPCSVSKTVKRCARTTSRHTLGSFCPVQLEMGLEETKPFFGHLGPLHGSESSHSPSCTMNSASYADHVPCTGITSFTKNSSPCTLPSARHTLGEGADSLVKYLPDWQNKTEHAGAFPLQYVGGFATVQRLQYGQEICPHNQQAHSRWFLPKNQSAMTLDWTLLDHCMVANQPTA